VVLPGKQPDQARNKGRIWCSGWSSRASNSTRKPGQARNKGRNWCSWWSSRATTRPGNPGKQGTEEGPGAPGAELPGRVACSGGPPGAPGPSPIPCLVGLLAREDHPEHQ
ncbi:hypothetical protein Dimus_020587, partial [Dionaea muscipula]